MDTLARARVGSAECGCRHARHARQGLSRTIREQFLQTNPATWRTFTCDGPPQPEITPMPRLSTSTNMTIFVLFFGISLFDAIASRNLARSVFWLAIGLMFLGASRFSRGG